MPSKQNSQLRSWISWMASLIHNSTRVGSLSCSNFYPKTVIFYVTGHLKLSNCSYKFCICCCKILKPVQQFITAPDRKSSVFSDSHLTASFTPACSWTTERASFNIVTHTLPLHDSGFYAMSNSNYTTLQAGPFSAPLISLSAARLNKTGNWSLNGSSPIHKSLQKKVFTPFPTTYLTELANQFGSTSHTFPIEHKSRHHNESNLPEYESSKWGNFSENMNHATITSLTLPNCILFRNAST